MKCNANSDITSDHTDQINFWLNAVYFYLANGSILTCFYYHALSLRGRHQIAKLRPFVHAHRAKYKAADSHSEVVDVEVIKPVGCSLNCVCLVLKIQGVVSKKCFCTTLRIKNVITSLFSSIIQLCKV